jgi:uncharacterized repeat protein (TIGR01451 family)
MAAVRAQETSRRKPSLFRPAPIQVPSEEPAPIQPAPEVVNADDFAAEPPRRESSVLNSSRRPRPTPIYQAVQAEDTEPAAPEMAADASGDDDEIGPIGAPRTGGAFLGSAPSEDEPRVAAVPEEPVETSPLKSVLKRGAAPPAPTPATTSPTLAAPRNEPAFKPAPSPPPEATGPSSRRTNSSGFQPKYSNFRASGASIQEANLTARSPQIRIDTRGPLALTLGKPASYTLEVLNEGDVSAQEIQVRVQFPSWVTVAASTPGAQLQDDPAGGQKLSWTISQLDSRYKKTLNFQVTANDGRSFDMPVDWAVRPAGQKAQIVVKQPRLELAITGPGELNFGEEKTFKVTISNPGNGEAESVVLNFQQAGGRAQRVEVGSLQAGQQREVPVQVAANQTGELELSATATGDGQLTADAQAKVLIRKPELVMTMDGPPLKFAGSEAVYAIVISNTGNAAAADVTAAVTLPAGVKYMGGIEGASVVPGGIKWRVGNVPQAGERTFEFTCQLTSAGMNRLDAQVRGPGGLSSGAAVETEVEAVADLKMSVNDPSGPIAVGEEVMYDLQVINRGTLAAQQVKIVMHFSEGIEPTSVEGAVGKVVPGQVVCTPLPQLGAGEQLNVKIKARAEAAGNHLYRVEVFAGEPETRLVSEGTTRFFADAGRGGAGRNVRKPTPAPAPVRR